MSKIYRISQRNDLKPPPVYQNIQVLKAGHPSVLEARSVLPTLFEIFIDKPFSG
ncbi:MAG: hypothetical protein HFG00_07955 [Oscillibacter sp.]|nr:hypothetical protein [Oscillibacter sp.]